MANVPISAFTVPANTVGIGATGYSLTGSASASFMDLAGTWNTSGTPTAIKLNITDTASNAASLLMDLQVGGASRASIRKGGGIKCAPSGNAYLLLEAEDFQHFNAGGTRDMLIGGNGLGVSLNSDYTVSWGTSATDVSKSLVLGRRGAANLRLGAADVGSTTATVTITIATPGVVTWSSHALSTGTPVFFTTTGALPTGITASTTYYVIAVDANTFRIATTAANALAGTAVNTSGSQSGTQTGNRNAITQALSVQSVTGVTNRPGADMLITGSQGTGTGAGGSLIFQVAPAGSSGTAQNALATALTINADRSITVAAASDSQARIAMADRGTVLSIYTNVFGDQPLLVSAPGGVSVNNNTGYYSLGSVADVRLNRDAANTLALRNGTAAQRFNVYNTWTSTTNYEAFKIDWITTANTVLVGTEKGSGGGTARALAFQTNGTTALTIAVGGVATFVSEVNVGNSNILGWGSGRAGLFAPTASAIRIAVSSGDAALNFGGDTSSFPALKRSTTFLQARLADDSAFAGFASANVQAATAYTVATLPGTPGTGMIARVTDATAPVIGATVAGGGAAYALVNYNGANWTVIGV